MASTQPVELVVGLGNPDGHAGDRHNAGFWFVDALAARSGCSLRDESRFKGELGRTPEGPRLLKPMTYMNLSGESVAACASYFRVPPEGVLVVHDELDLEPGVVRLKRGGGHGGHNGLRSVEQHLGSRNYLRVRLGIGHPGQHEDVSGWVLRRPRPEERERIDTAIEDTLDIIEMITDGRFDRAMTRLNRREPD